MFCSQHDSVLCAACVAMEHKKCKEVIYLPVATKDIANSEEYRDILSRIDTLSVELGEWKIKRLTDRTRLTKENDDALARIKYTRKKINKYLDNLEKVTRDSLQEEYTSFVERIDKELKTFDEIRTSLETMEKELKLNYQTKETQLFIHMRRTKQVIANSEKAIVEVSKMIGKEQIQFLPDTKLLAFIKSAPSLGTFGSQQRLFASSLVGQFDVHVSTDAADCQIMASDFLPDGKVIITDWENKRVKLLDTNYKVLNDRKLTGSPYGVCCVSDKEAVVCVTNKKLLQSINIDSKNKFSEGRIIKVGKLCRDIVFWNSQLFVVCKDVGDGGQSQIRVYGVRGEFLRNIAVDANGKNIFQRPLYLSVNSIGNIYVSDEMKGVVMLDDAGNVTSTFTNKALKYPYGISVITNDQILVCGFGTHNVVQLGRNGIYLGDVVPESYKLRNPRSVSFDVNTQRILVACKNSNFIRIFNLK